MRKVMLLAAAVLACSKAETPAADTAAAPAAPAMLTAADVAGNWSGVGMPETGDSVLTRWTAVRLTDSTGKLAYEGVKDSVAYTIAFDADSMIATSVPYIDPANPKGPQVTFRSVGWLKDGALSGKSMVMLAAKPDSVVARGRWKATRAS